MAGFLGGAGIAVGLGVLAFVALGLTAVEVDERVDDRSVVLHQDEPRNIDEASE